MGGSLGCKKPEEIGKLVIEKTYEVKSLTLNDIEKRIKDMGSVSYFPGFIYKSSCLARQLIRRQIISKDKLRYDL